MSKLHAHGVRQYLSGPGEQENQANEYVVSSFLIGQNMDAVVDYGWLRVRKLCLGWSLFHKAATVYEPQFPVMWPSVIIFDVVGRHGPCTLGTGMSHYFFCHQAMRILRYGLLA